MTGPYHYKRAEEILQPDAGHALQPAVRDLDRRQPAVPRDAARPRVPPRLVHRGRDLLPPAVPAGRDLGQRPPRGRHRGDRPEQLPLVAHHPEIADHPGPVRDRARQVREDPAPVMAAQRRRQRRRQPGCQARPVRQLPQQGKARVRHDPRAAAGDVKTTRPSCSVHGESAPRTWTGKCLDNPYRPRSGALFHSGAPPSRRTPVKSQG